MRCVALLLAIAACGDDGASGPALTVEMSIPIVEGVNGTPSVFDPLIGQTFGLSFVASSAPAFDHGMATSCLFTDFDLQSSERVASGAMADLVQRELVDGTTVSTLHVEKCDAGRPSVSITLREGAPYQAFFSCFVADNDLPLDADGYPELASLTVTDCHATIDDVSAFRNFQSAPYSTVFTVRGTIP